MLDNMKESGVYQKLPTAWKNILKRLTQDYKV